MVGEGDKKARKQGRDIPRTAAWGKLIIGVPYNDPKTPPFELRSRTDVSAQILRYKVEDRCSSHSESPPSHVFQRQLPIPSLS